MSQIDKWHLVVDNYDEWHIIVDNLWYENLSVIRNTMRLGTKPPWFHDEITLIG